MNSTEFIHTIDIIILALGIIFLGISQIIIVRRQIKIMEMIKNGK